MKYNEMRNIHTFVAGGPYGGRARLELLERGRMPRVIGTAYRACPREGWYEEYVMVPGTRRVKVENGKFKTHRVYARYQIVDRRTGDVVQRSEG